MTSSYVCNCNSPCRLYRLTQDCLIWWLTAMASLTLASLSADMATEEVLCLEAACAAADAAAFLLPFLPPAIALLYMLHCRHLLARRCDILFFHFFACSRCGYTLIKYVLRSTAHKPSTRELALISSIISLPRLKFPLIRSPIASICALHSVWLHENAQNVTGLSAERMSSGRVPAFIQTCAASLCSQTTRMWILRCPALQILAQK